MVICWARKWLLKWLTNNVVDQLLIQEFCPEIRFRFCYNDTIFQSQTDILLVSPKNNS